MQQAPVPCSSFFKFLSKVSKFLKCGTLPQHCCGGGVEEINELAAAWALLCVR